MKKMNSVLVEYQGISIINKDVPVLKGLLKKYFPDAELKTNPHVCLEYFGTRRLVDRQIEKQKSLFPEKTMGKQVPLQIIAIGYLKKDGKLVNVSALIDDSVYYDVKIEDKTLANYNKANMPWITLYNNAETMMNEDGKEIKTMTVKESSRCFSVDNLRPGEAGDTIYLDEPVTVTGELCAFRHQQKIYRVQNGATRLIMNKTIRNDCEILLNAEIDNEYTKKRKQEREQREKEAETLFSEH